MHRHLARRTLSVAALAVGLGTAFATTASAEGHHSPTPAGHVYEATNASNGNAIQVFDRGDDGRLTAGALVATGGLGDGASLHSQGGVVRQGNLLFAVNARSATVSALQITDHGLVLRDTVATLGTLPVSVTARDGVGYVVNQGSDTITGFRYASDGDLSPLPGSTRALTPNPAGGITDAAQIQFTPDGSALLVTEKASNTLDTFAVRGGGMRARPCRTLRPGPRRTASTSTPAVTPSSRRRLSPRRRPTRSAGAASASSLPRSATPRPPPAGWSWPTSTPTR